MSRYKEYDERAIRLLGIAQDLVRKRGSDQCAPDDLLHAFLLAEDDPAWESFLKLNGVEIDHSRLATLKDLLTGPSPAAETAGEPGEPPARSKIRISDELRQIFANAEDLRDEGGPGQKVQPVHLLHSAWPYLSGRLGSFFKEAGGKQPPEKLELPPLPVTDRSAPATEAKTVPLRCLPELARELTAADLSHPIVGRDLEIENVITVLLKFFKPNPLLLGEAGVGKSAIVEGLADRIRQGKVPPALRNARIFELRISDIVAGAGVHGEYEKRLRQIITEVENNPDVILFLDEIHMLEQEGRNTNPADVFKPALARGQFRCIGATTAEEYQRILARDAALCRRFQNIRVDEPDKQAMGTILRGIQASLENHHRIRIPEECLDLTLRLAGECLVHRRFPDKALDILDRACSAAALEGIECLNHSLIRNAVSRISGVEFIEDSEEFRGRLDTLEDTLSRRILGQEHAAAAATNIIRLCKARLDLRPERPDGVLLFTGPSGVGKTAFAEVLAEHLTGSAGNLIRLDMSEFSESHSVSRLTGSPAGYVGYGDESGFLRQLRSRPNGVLLLDEFEKAHPAVQRLFLQVFDTGRFTDARGETLSLASITIIATANLCSPSRKAVGFSAAENRDDLSGQEEPIPMDLLKSHFPLELINRFDEIVAFHRVNRDTARRILTERILSAANENLERSRNLRLVLDPTAQEHILDVGYSVELGVRNLQRAFEEIALHPLASQMDMLKGGSAESPGGENPAVLTLLVENGAPVLRTGA